LVGKVFGDVGKSAAVSESGKRWRK